MSVPVAPGCWPVLGHAPALLRRGFGFTEGLHAHGDVVRGYIGTLPMYIVTTPELTHRVLVIDSASFGKGAVFDKFRPFVGNGLVNSGGAFHLGCVPRGAGNRTCVGNAFAMTETVVTVATIASHRRLEPSPTGPCESSTPPPPVPHGCR